MLICRRGVGIAEVDLRVTTLAIAQGLQATRLPQASLGSGEASSGSVDAKTPAQLGEELKRYIEKIRHLFEGIPSLTPELLLSEEEEERLLILFNATRLTEMGQCRI